MAGRTITDSIETDAALAPLLALLENASAIPQWAPAFADHVTSQSDGRFTVTKGPNTFKLRVATERSSGCVDYLREMAPGVEGGAYIRVFPRPQGGSVIVMTVPLGPTSDAEAVGEELRRELENLVKLVHVDGD
jgi:hypothetical protein